MSNKWQIPYKTEEEETILHTYSLARSLTLDTFTHLFDAFINAGGKQYREGEYVGNQLRSIHRSLQRCVVAFCLGLIVGISDQQFTDPRNETAIQTAKKIKEMIDTDRLPLGPYI